MPNEDGTRQEHRAFLWGAAQERWLLLWEGYFTSGGKGHVGSSSDRERNHGSGDVILRATCGREGGLTYSRSRAALAVLISMVTELTGISEQIHATAAMTQMTAVKLETND